MGLDVAALRQGASYGGVHLSSAASKTTVVASSFDPDATIETASEAFSELLTEYCPDAAVQLRRCHTNGRGLFAAAEILTPNKAILRIPIETCLVVDYGDGPSAGVRLPGGDWPRVSRGIKKDDALPWDIIQSLALLDGISGSGDSDLFWQRYTNHILPEPILLTLPVCLPEVLLHMLGHADIIQGALAQKSRLAQMFPGLAVQATGGGPTWMEYAFGCVRSRAFALDQERFAFVPFLDTANHAADPNANFVAPPNASCVNLVSLKPISEGEEVTISYTGPHGATNQRMMAQYGFVPRHGNAFDRLRFQYLEEKNDTLLSLDAMQAALGDGEAMVDAFSGRDTYTYAALKSLPLAAMESDAAPLTDQLDLARALLGELQAEREQWATSTEADAAELMRLESMEGADPREEMVVRYRYQRKRLIDAATSILEAFMHR